MTNPRYYATLDRNGIEDELTIHGPDGRPMLSVGFWDDEDSPTASRLKADAELIVNALNAYQPPCPLFDEIKGIIRAFDASRS